MPVHFQIPLAEKEERVLAPRLAHSWTPEYVGRSSSQVTVLATVPSRTAEWTKGSEPFRDVERGGFQKARGSLRLPRGACLLVHPDAGGGDGAVDGEEDGR